MWSCQPVHRVLLSIGDGARAATLSKSSYLPQGVVAYAITEAGVVDVPPP